MLKKLFLQKGWAGKTISRSETVDRINLIIRQHTVLNRSYDAAESALSDFTIASLIPEMQKRARMNVGKLAEVVFSNGGVAYSGTDIEPSTIRLGSSDGQILRALEDLERGLLNSIREESGVEHHMRTRAILKAAETDSAARLEALAGHGAR
jgi:hypothetical protein